MKAASKASAASFAMMLRLCAGLSFFFISPATEAPAKSVAEVKAHWAFQPVRNPPWPPVRDGRWPKTAVDRFILQRLEAAGSKPAQAADKQTLIRRATFDLTGLPPTPEEIDAFVADESPDAFARVIDRLLNSPHYGERWGRHWLDVVRYADTAGETADYPLPMAWRYRNYVIDSFNADKPYDTFIKEQIAGDILARRGSRDRYAERVVATGFVALSRRFGFDSENYHHLTIQDTIDTIGQTVLGLSIGCARCHHHKYDPISMNDYYGLYGMFESTRYAFPGSEQKQKHRALAPLVSAEESRPKWREFESRVAALTRLLEKAKQSAPSAVLRSLDDLDGDFEMQAIASGGSKGVLVPPWFCEGNISVTKEAQSPFRNLHPAGKVGVSVAGGTNRYWIGQALHPPRTPDNTERLHVNLDFRVGTNDPPTKASHRFWLGSRGAAENGSGALENHRPVFELLIGADSIVLRSGEGTDRIRSLRPNAWQNLQLELDFKSRSIAGRIGSPEDLVVFTNKIFLENSASLIDFVGFNSAGTESGALPALEIDHVAVEELPFAPVSTSFAYADRENDAGPGFDALNFELKALAGIDGDFELQIDQRPPAIPWHPGPNSAVTISRSAQSPFRNLYGAGELGIRLPQGGAYNGFGQTLSNVWTAGKTGRLFVSFDFRTAPATESAGGSWRFYVGRGAGASAAVELFISRTQIFRRSGEDRDLVKSLQPGEWHQVQLDLDLKTKRYTGVIATAQEKREFSGAFATGWDGSIDYTFIDSYGHVPGAKPQLDADNFCFSESPLAPIDSERPLFAAADSALRGNRVAEIRQQLAQIQQEAEKAKQELHALLANGPFDMAYAVAEGTPQNARLHLRGEPDKPGAEVPRGFLKALGGGDLPGNIFGSGRLELAEWLTHPDNPLTARVMVNRIWQYHFGEGLVKTPNDFGTRGQPPAHPELLDFLAAQFVQSGWSIKAMHRLIMLSATYRQSSIPRAQQQPAASDSGSAPFAAFSSFARRRLSAEEIRDAILFVSGELDDSPARGHPFPPPTSWGFTQHGPFSAVYDHNQRSVYLMTQRLKRHPFLALFDGADPNASTAERRPTTVPTQALYFLNDPFVHAKAAKLARRIERACTEDSMRLTLAYRLTLGRAPAPEELAEMTGFLSAYRSELASAKAADPELDALAACVRVLFGSNEFLHVD